MASCSTAAFAMPPPRPAPKDYSNVPYRRWRPNPQNDEAWREHQAKRLEEIAEMQSRSIATIPREPNEKGVKLVTVAGFNCFRLILHPNLGKRTDLETDEDFEETEAIRDEATQTYRITMDIGRQYFKFIIGAKGATRDDIEKATGASLLIPKADDTTSPIVIRAVKAASCVIAKQRIQMIVEGSRNKVDYTHFLSIPFRNAKEELKALFTSIDKKFAGVSRGVTSDVIQRAERVHFTLVLLRLYSAEEVSRAHAIMTKLQSFLDDVFSIHNTVHLKGLNYMNDDPSEVNVLYLQAAANETTERILRLVEFASKEFIEAGLCTERDIEHNQKLHATVMNSKWRKEETPTGPRPAPGDGEQQPTRAQVKSFDIRALMKDFANYDVGSFPLQTLELSRLGEHGQDGYWKADKTAVFR